MKYGFQPWVHTVFHTLRVNAAFMKARKFHMEQNCIIVPSKGTNLADPAPMAQSSTFLCFFSYGQNRIDKTRMTMQHHGSAGSSCLLAKFEIA